MAGVYAGHVGTLPHGHASVRSAIVKHAVEGSVYLSIDGLEGDEQADRRHHGGPNKAVLVFPVEHYRAGPASPAGSLPAGTLGENFSTRGLFEPAVCIGDIFSVGESVVQVTQPRRPCFKLGARHQIPDLAIRLQRAGHTGFYLRVLQPGVVQAGETMRLTVAAAHGVTLAEVNRVMNLDKSDVHGIRQVLRAGADLPAAWQAQLRERLANPKRAEGDEERLTGGETSPH